MVGLSPVEATLMHEVASTSDFIDWRTFDRLEARGLLGWVSGPLTRELDLQEPSDPVVTPLGSLLLRVLA